MHNKPGKATTKRQGQLLIDFLLDENSGEVLSPGTLHNKLTNHKMALDVEKAKASQLFSLGADIVSPELRKVMETELAEKAQDLAFLEEVILQKF